MIAVRAGVLFACSIRPAAPTVLSGSSLSLNDIRLLPRLTLRLDEKAAVVEGSMKSATALSGNVGMSARGMSSVETRSASSERCVSPS